MAGYTLDVLKITETFYGWYNKTNDIIELLNSVAGDGISGASLDNGNLILELIDGTTLDAGPVIGPTGPGIAGASIVGDNLILTLDNSEVIDAGDVRGPTGNTGESGATGSTGESGVTGATGVGVPPEGFIGYALVKASNDDYDTEWSDISSVSRSHPGKIGGYEGGTGSLIFGRGLDQSGRILYPRWSFNNYLSQVHKGPGISMAGATGMYDVAGMMEGYTTGYDDGLTSGIRVLNFLENTIAYEGNVYNQPDSVCLGRTLDGPPGYYWNRMKYFPTIKLQPFYIGNYCYVDKYVGYISGYENGVDQQARRGMYGWFGVIKANSFPTGTPQSEFLSNDGFVNGSTCAYFFRDEGVGLCGNGFAVSQTDSNFGVTGYTYAAWTGDYVREVNPGRTGPIAFYPEASGADGIGPGFVLSPGWYFLMTEFIPTAWFSVGSGLDEIDDNLSYEKGISGDQVIITHTDARNHYGDASLFGLNGFELAPAGEDTGVGEPFVPSAYLSIASIKDGRRDIPTGLSPYLWFTQGLSGDEEKLGRFGGTTDTGYYINPHRGLHQISQTVDSNGGLAIRAQNPEQGSAPRIALSIKSSASQLDSLRNIDIGTNPPDESNFCVYTWDGLSPWGGTGEPDPFNDNQCTDCLGGTAGNRPFDWHRILFGAYQGTTNDLGTDPDDVSYSSVNGSITYKIQLTCETGECPTFCAPPGFPISESITKTRIATSPVPYDVGFDDPNDQDLWLSIGGSTTDYGSDGDVLVDPQGNIVQVPRDSDNNIGEFNNVQSFRSTGDNPGELFEFTFIQEIISTQHGWYFPSGAANHGDITGYNCDSHYPGSDMNPAGLTTAGATANPEEGWIKIFDDSGNAYFFGFYNGETAETLQGATTGCSECYTGHHGTSGDYSSCGGVLPDPPDDGYEPDSGQGSGGGPATISTYVNVQEAIHQAWYGEFSGAEKNHLIKYTSYYGCTSGTSYPEYQGP